jgi:hypothetical protein
VVLFPDLRRLDRIESQQTRMGRYMLRAAKNIAGKVKIPDYVRSAFYIALAVVTIIVLYDGLFNKFGYFSYRISTEYLSVSGRILFAAQNVLRHFIIFFIPVLLMEINKNILISAASTFSQSKYTCLAFQIFYIFATLFVFYKFYTYMAHENLKVFCWSYSKWMPGTIPIAFHDYSYGRLYCGMSYGMAFLILMLIQFLLLPVAGILWILARGIKWAVWRIWRA